ncbi:hypothetical protein HYFRA_00008862 [Hymenoscyphus fraxineus]|uniref:Uncharacterized protein n=1 Tax=Hymenoscyphus fraxineus TaxID=746836 RepID=A0A9N9KXZ3_9HELO|nr:hypothetical protein HYFRA_00008862 [Hymenoscyphus fraxineus]
MLLKYSSLLALATFFSSIAAEAKHNPVAKNNPVKDAIQNFMVSVVGGKPLNPPDKGVTSATFDEAGNIPLQTLRQVGTYKGISYNGFQLVSLPRGGLIAQSGNNVALYGTQGATNLGRPNLETDDNPFDLHEFYFGCVLLGIDGPIFDSPQPCTLTIKSERQDGSQFSQQFRSMPDSPLQARMFRAIVDTNFTGIRVVRFESLPDLQVVTIFDNFVYTLNAK